MASLLSSINYAPVYDVLYLVFGAFLSTNALIIILEDIEERQYVCGVSPGSGFQRSCIKECIMTKVSMVYCPHLLY